MRTFLVLIVATLSLSCFHVVAKGQNVLPIPALLKSLEGMDQPAIIEKLMASATSYNEKLKKVKLKNLAEVEKFAADFDKIKSQVELKVLEQDVVIQNLKTHLQEIHASQWLKAADEEKLVGITRRVAKLLKDNPLLWSRLWNVLKLILGAGIAAIMFAALYGVSG